MTQRYTPEEDKIIRKGYAASVPVIEIARKLGRNEGSIRGRARYLGLLHSSQHHFTSEEDAIIRQDYAAYVPTTEIARKLKCNKDAIRYRIRCLSLHRSNHVSQLLKRVPKHLAERVDTMPPEQFIEACYQWRDEQRQKITDTKIAHEAEIAKACAEIDQRQDLSRKERMIAKRAIGMTLEAIGQQHGISHERVRQITSPRIGTEMQGAIISARLLLGKALPPDQTQYADAMLNSAVLIQSIKG